MADPPRDAAHSLVGRLYDAYGASLYRYAVLLLADFAAAEDAVQQVFAAILRRPPRLEYDDARYLRRAVRNECYSILRRRQRQVGDEGGGALIEPVVEGVAPDERLALERAIRELSPEQREVIHLHVFEGLTFQEVADAAEVSINTIAARYRYALAKLRQLLTATR